MALQIINISLRGDGNYDCLFKVSDNDGARMVVSILEPTHFRGWNQITERLIDMEIIKDIKDGDANVGSQCSATRKKNL